MFSPQVPVLPESWSLLTAERGWAESHSHFWSIATAQIYHWRYKWVLLISSPWVDASDSRIKTKWGCSQVHWGIRSFLDLKAETQLSSRPCGHCGSPRSWVHWNFTISYLDPKAPTKALFPMDGCKIIAMHRYKERTSYSTILLLLFWI